jgi:hypothetical protein
MRTENRISVLKLPPDLGSEDETAGKATERKVFLWPKIRI